MRTFGLFVFHLPGWALFLSLCKGEGVCEIRLKKNKKQAENYKHVTKPLMKHLLLLYKVALEILISDFLQIRLYMYHK